MCFAELVVLPDWWKCTSIWLVGWIRNHTSSNNLGIPHSWPHYGDTPPSRTCLQSVNNNLGLAGMLWRAESGEVKFTQTRPQALGVQILLNYSVQLHFASIKLCWLFWSLNVASTAVTVGFLLRCSEVSLTQLSQKYNKNLVIRNSTCSVLGGGSTDPSRRAAIHHVSTAEIPACLPAYWLRLGWRHYPLCTVQDDARVGIWG